MFPRGDSGFLYVRPGKLGVPGSPAGAGPSAVAGLSAVAGAGAIVWGRPAGHPATRAPEPGRFRVSVLGLP